MNSGQQHDQISNLINRNLEDTLLKIFMNLDLKSLSAAKQTCRKWNNFIRGTVGKHLQRFKIRKLKSPKDWQGLYGRIVSIKYFKKFYPNYVRNTNVMRELAETNKEYRWIRSHKDAFNKMKETLELAHEWESWVGTALDDVEAQIKKEDNIRVHITSAQLRRAYYQREYVDIYCQNAEVKESDSIASRENQTWRETFLDNIDPNINTEHPYLYDMLRELIMMCTQHTHLLLHNYS